MIRTIKTNAGIGDSIWLFMKLLSTGEKFHFQIADGEPRRGKQIFDLIPQLSESCTYVRGLYYKRVNRGSVHRFRTVWKKIRDRVFMLSANEHLEKGHRIETFLPDLETHFVIPWATTETDKSRGLIYTPEGGKYVGIYCSSYKTADAWKFWGAEKWFEFIKLIHAADPDFRFVIIGAEWDLDIATELIALIDQHNATGDDQISYMSSVGEQLSVVVEILKRLELFCGFPSGLSILNETIPGKNTVMFYPPHLEGLMNSWADPERIESGAYTPLLFCEPEDAYSEIAFLVEAQAVEVDIPRETKTIEVDNSLPTDPPKGEVKVNNDDELQPSADEKPKSKNKASKKKPNESPSK